MRFGTLLTTLVWVGLSTALGAQRPPVPLIRSSAQEVLLDLVVRDSKQRLVNNLTRADFVVYEDGVQQTIRSLTNSTVTGGASQPAAGVAQDGRTPPAAAAPTLDPLRQIHVVSLVFDRLDAGAKRMVNRAMGEFLADSLPPNTYVAVFVLDRQLKAIQEYTADVALLRNAITRATAGLYDQYTRDSERILEKYEYMSGAPSGAGVDKALRGVIVGALLAELRTQRNQQGAWQLEALQTLMVQQHRIPGRKTVVYFSAGLTVPNQMKDRLEHLIGVANRNNVAVYYVDTRGLRALERQGTPGYNEGLDEVRSMTEDWDDVPLSNRRNLEQTQGNLATLAENTGGFLVANSNDLRVPLRRIMDQAQSHYELAYAPTNAEYDGRFRKIEVKVLRQGLKVQTRSGYYAVPLLAGETLQPYEIALLNAMEAKPQPRDVSYQLGVARLNRQFDGIRCLLQIQVPLAGLSPAPAGSGKSWRRRVAWMALVKDRDGHVVEKRSRDVTLEGESAKRRDGELGDLTESEDLNLDAGQYTIDAAVLDRQAMKASVKRMTFAVPVDEKVWLSDVIRVRQPAPAGDNREYGTALLFRGERLLPTLSGRVRPGFANVVRLFFRVNALADGGKPAVRIELLRDGAKSKLVPALLEEQGKDGCVSYLAELPAGDLRPGNYEVVITAQQGQTVAEQIETFEVIAP